jgi:hypothetical protein
MDAAMEAAEESLRRTGNARNDGVPVTCGTTGAPNCGHSGERLIRITPTEQEADAAALRFRWDKSPADPNWKLNVVDAQAAYDVEHGIGIVLSADGEVYTTDIQLGTAFRVDVEVNLEPGERLLGIAHTHPPVDTGNVFSTGDIAAGVHMNSVEPGFSMYLVQPRTAEYGPGVLLFDVTRNRIYSVP